MIESSMIEEVKRRRFQVQQIHASGDLELLAVLDIPEGWDTNEALRGVIDRIRSQPERREVSLQVCTPESEYWMDGDMEVNIYHAPPIAHILQYFEYSHLPPHLQEVSKPVCELAHQMADTLPQGDELIAGLRKLLEAKDCFVRTQV